MSRLQLIINDQELDVLEWDIRRSFERDCTVVTAKVMPPRRSIGDSLDDVMRRWAQLDSRPPTLQE